MPITWRELAALDAILTAAGERPAAVVVSVIAAQFGSGKPGEFHTYRLIDKGLHLGR